MTQNSKKQLSICNNFIQFVITMLISDELKSRQTSTLWLTPHEMVSQLMNQDQVIVRQISLVIKQRFPFNYNLLLLLSLSFRFAFEFIH